MPSVAALVCTEPGKLVIAHRPAPSLADGYALVRPLRVGICGTDYHIYEGSHPFLNYPRVMGHELAVEVVDAPADSGFAKGEVCVVNPYISCGHCIACRAGKPNCCVNIAVLGVHTDGGMTEFISLPARNLVHAAGLSADACAAVEFLAIGAHAVSRGGVSKGDRALVVGAGPIGLGAALFARLAGAEVAVLDREAERSASAQAIAGAAVVPMNGSAADSVSVFTGGDGFDVVFDATGSLPGMQASFDYVAHGGRLVLVSVIRGDITFSDPDFHRREMTLFASRNALAADFDRVIAAIRAGHVPLDKIITHRTSLESAVTDLPRWTTVKSGLIKALIEIG